MPTEHRDTQRLFRGISIMEFVTASTSTHEYAGWSVTSISPNRVFNPKIVTLPQLAEVVATLVMDLTRNAK